VESCVIVGVCACVCVCVCDSVCARVYSVGFALLAKGPGAKGAAHRQHRCELGNVCVLEIVAVVTLHGEPVIKLQRRLEITRFD
jgi:hypothetical protein